LSKEALRHTVGRDEHMPYLKQLVEGHSGLLVEAFQRFRDRLALARPNERALKMGLSER